MAKVKKKNRKNSYLNTSLTFTKKNYSIFGIGILFIIVGYIALAQGPAESYSSLTIGPVLLVIGYCVIIPIAILYRNGNESDKTLKQGD